MPLALLLVVALLAPSSVDVHRRLVPAWEALLTVTERDGTPHGAAYELIARAAGVRIVLVAGRARGRAGYYRGQRVVGVDPSLLVEDPHAVAAIVAHELTHAAQHTAARRGAGPTDCFEAEADAFERQAIVWLLSWPEGELPERTDIERELTLVARTYEDEGPDGIRRLLEAAAPYRERCATWVPQSARGMMTPGLFHAYRSAPRPWSSAARSL